MSRTWVTADDGTTPLVEIVVTDDGEGWTAVCVEHGQLDVSGSFNDVVEQAGNHVDREHQAVTA